MSNPFEPQGPRPDRVGSAGYTGAPGYQAQPGYTDPHQASVPRYTVPETTAYTDPAAGYPAQGEANQAYPQQGDAGQGNAPQGDAGQGNAPQGDAGQGNAPEGYADPARSGGYVGQQHGPGSAPAVPDYSAGQTSAVQAYAESGAGRHTVDQNQGSHAVSTGPETEPQAVMQQKGLTESQLKDSDPEAYERLRRSDDRSLGAILGDITNNVSRLVNQELALFKAEATQSAKKVGTGAGMMAGAVVGGLFVLTFLSWALWWALATAIGDAGELAGGWAALIVALIWAAIAAGLYFAGKASIDKAKGVPQTVDTLTKIPNALTGDEEKN